MENYRQKYMSEYGILPSKDYEIYHIDLNHSNNDMNNLVLLPKQLHHKYHSLLKCVENIEGDIFSKCLNAEIHSSVFCGDQFNLEMIKELADTLQECNKWYDYKLYLEGKLPNIHNIIL